MMFGTWLQGFVHGLLIKNVNFLKICAHFMYILYLFRSKEIKVEPKSEPSDGTSLPACVAQPVYGSSMPPPPGVEPVQLPVKQEPADNG